MIKIDKGVTAAIGEWVIYRQMSPVGKKSWNGKAMLIDESRLLPGAARGSFTKDDKTYSGDIILTEIPYHWSKNSGESPVIITFQGSGKLNES